MPMPHHAVLNWQHPFGLLRLALLVCLCCWISVVLTRGDGRVAAIWLSNGVVLGLLLSSQTKDWLPLLGAGFLGNVVANFLVGDNTGTALSLAACNSVEIMAAAAPLRRRFGMALQLSSTLGLLYFAAFSLLVAPTLSALLASVVLSPSHALSGLPQFPIWLTAHAMGLLIVTPLVMALCAHADLQSHRRGWQRVLLPWTLLLLTSTLVFTQNRYPLLFLPFPPLLILSYLHGLRGSVLGLATITVVAVGATSLGQGPIMLIETHSVHVRILFLQVFLLIAAAQGLVVGLLLAQRERLSMALARSEQTMRTITDNLPALISYIDADQRYRFVNAHIGRVFGDDPAKLLGRTVREVRGEMIYAELAPIIEQTLQGQPAHFESHGMANGKAYHYQANYIPDVDSNGTVRGLYAMTFDITDRKNAELRQAADEERLRTITDNLPALIAYLDRNGVYRFCNGTHDTWFGKPVADWLGAHYQDVISEAFGQVQQPHITAALQGERVETEILLHTRGTARSLRASYLPHHAGDGRILGVYLLMHDISHLKAVQAELNQLARSDMLTGLANRREFQERLEAAIAHNRRHGSDHGLMFLDIDHFKAINDHHGHAAGDAVLCEVARRLQASVRVGDTVARLAGDEFVVILATLQTAEASLFVARKIIAAMEKPVTTAEGLIQVGVSIGIAFNPKGALSETALLARADSALYEAKAAGRNNFKLHGGVAHENSPLSKSLNA